MNDQWLKIGNERRRTARTEFNFVSHRILSSQTASRKQLYGNRDGDYDGTRICFREEVGLCLYSIQLRYPLFVKCQCIQIYNPRNYLVHPVGFSVCKKVAVTWRSEKLRKSPLCTSSVLLFLLLDRSKNAHLLSP